MAKYLNIDALAPEKKILTLKGVDYEMHQITVQEFVELVRKQNEDAESKSADEMTVDQRIMSLVEQIQKAFPNIPTEELTGLALEQLTAIIKFVMGTLEEEQEAKDEAKEVAKSGKGKN